jgi:hypothetical protein
MNKSPGTPDTQMNVAEQPHAEYKLLRQLLGSLPGTPLQGAFSHCVEKYKEAPTKLTL